MPRCVKIKIRSLVRLGQVLLPAGGAPVQPGELVVDVRLHLLLQLPLLLLQLHVGVVVTRGVAVLVVLLSAALIVPPAGAGVAPAAGPPPPPPPLPMLLFLLVAIRPLPRVFLLFLPVISSMRFIFFSIFSNINVCFVHVVQNFINKAMFNLTK